MRQIGKKITMDKRTVRLLGQLVLTVLVFVSLSINGSLSYLSNQTVPVSNNFTMGIPKVEINEPSVDPDHVQWGANSKPVTLSVPLNAGGGVVRASFIPMFKNAAGVLAQPISNQLVCGDITLHFTPGWDTNWFYRNGYFYYKTVLAPGQTTTMLLSGVTLTANTPEMITKYQDISVEIEVLADILQKNADTDTLWGVTVDDSGNVS